MATLRFSNDILVMLRRHKILRIRAGNGSHRFIGIWVVVVKDRVFVRSWSLKPQGWFQTFTKEPVGSVQIAAQEIRVRAVRTRSETLKRAVDRAYVEKYNSRGEIKYAKDLVRPNSRGATIELIPFHREQRA